MDRRLENNRARLNEALWSRDRSRELGITGDPEQRFSFAVLDYAIRGLYAEISNITQLRDEIASGTTRDPSDGCRDPRADPPSSAHGLNRVIEPRAYPPTMIRPPSTASSCPVMKPEPAPAKNTSIGPRSGPDPPAPRPAESSP